MQNKNSNSVDRLIGCAKRVAGNSSPFLKTRVLASAFELEQARRSSLIWKIIASAVSFALVTIIFIQFNSQKKTSENLTSIKIYNAIPNRPYVVEINLKELKDQDFKQAVIKLPQGVYFAVNQNLETSAEQSLEIDWKYIKDRTSLSIVLIGKENGLKTVEVDFVSNTKENSHKQNFNIQFKS